MEIAWLLTDRAAMIFNNLESIRIGGNFNRKGDIIDYFYGIVAGKSVSTGGNHVLRSRLQ